MLTVDGNPFVEVLARRQLDRLFELTAAKRRLHRRIDRLLLVAALGQILHRFVRLVTIRARQGKTQTHHEHLAAHSRAPERVRIVCFALICVSGEFALILHE